MRLCIITSLLLTILLATTTKAQERCNISVRISPDIRGIKLGMDYEAVKSLLKNSLSFALAPNSDALGKREIELTAIDLFDKPQFNGIQAIVLQFTDNKVSGVGAAYDESTQWDSIDAFTLHISKVLAMPFVWRHPTNTDPKKSRIMDCKDFRLIASTEKDRPSFIALVDTQAERLVAERKQALEEKKRKEFKP